MKHPHQKFETDPEILKKQVVIETYRSRGPGGQRKNKTETAVRLKHLLSGITVVATEQRTQSQNLKQAFERLRMRLLRLNRPRKRRIPTSTPVKAHERRIEEKKVPETAFFSLPFQLERTSPFEQSPGLLQHKGVKLLAIKGDASREGDFLLSAYAEDHGLCPWMNA